MVTALVVVAVSPAAVCLTAGGLTVVGPALATPRALNHPAAGVSSTPEDSLSFPGNIAFLPLLSGEVVCFFQAPYGVVLWGKFIQDLVPSCVGISYYQNLLVRRGAQSAPLVGAGTTFIPVRCCELLSVAGMVRVSLCGRLWRPAARPPPRTCLVWNGMVLAVVPLKATFRICSTGKMR